MTPGLQHAQPTSVQDLIASALLAVQTMDATKSEDLRAMLTLAAHEADRVIAASAKKPKQVKAAKEAPAKKLNVKKANVKAAAAPVAQKAVKVANPRTKKAHAINGAAH